MPDWLKPVATPPDSKGDFQLKVPVSVGGISLKPGKYNFYQLHNQYKDKLPPIRQPRGAAAGGMTKAQQPTKKGKSRG